MPSGRLRKVSMAPESITKKCAPTIFGYQVQGCLLHLEHVSGRSGLAYFWVIRCWIERSEAESMYIE